MNFKKKIKTTLKGSVLGFTALTVLLSAPSAFGQDTAKSNIPFAFQVSTKTLPAGEYTFTIDRFNGVVKVNGDKTGAEEMIITAIIGRPYTGDPNESHIVFDKSGNQYILSEIWVPGEDGVLVHATKGPHTHHVIHAKSSKHHK